MTRQKIPSNLTLEKLAQVDDAFREKYLDEEIALKAVAVPFSLGFTLSSLFKALETKRQYLEKRIRSSGFFYLGGKISAEKTIIEERYGVPIEVVSSLDQLDYPQEKNLIQPYRFIDHLRVKEVNNESFGRGAFYYSGEAVEEATRVYRLGSFILERLGEEKRFTYAYRRNVSSKLWTENKFSDILKGRGGHSPGNYPRTFALLFKPFDGSEKMESAPFTVVKYFHPQPQIGINF